MCGEAKIVGPVFAGRQFVCSSRNLLAKLHDHKLCSPNLFTRQRGRWRFNYSVEAFSIDTHVCVCVLGEIPGRLPRFLSSTQQNYATTELESEKSSLPLRFFGSEREKIFRDFGKLSSWQAPIPIVAYWPERSPSLSPHNCRPLPSQSRAEKSKSRDVFDAAIPLLHYMNAKKQNSQSIRKLRISIVLFTN